MRPTVPRKTVVSAHLAAACLGLLAGTAEGALAAATRQPNVIVLLADDPGYGDLGCQGNPQILTSQIDSIARAGIRFTQGYVTGPNCSPSRAGFLTGRIPTRFGYEYNPIGPRNEDPGAGLPAREVTRMVSSMDIFATSAHRARIEVPEGIDGVNLMPYVKGTNAGSPHDTLYWQQGNYTALRHRNWKLLNMRGPIADPQWELYDVASDLGETTVL